MTKKANSPKTAAPKKAGKKSKPEQLKIAGTGRTDAIEAIEEQAEKYVAARDARMEMQADEDAEQEVLAALLKEHKLTEYIFVDDEGVKRRAYLGGEVRAKVQKVKAKKTEEEA